MISTKLLDLVAELLQVKASTLNGESQREQTPGWDSLMHCQIMTEIEFEFDLDFSMDEMQNTTSLLAIQNLITEKSNEA